MSGQKCSSYELEREQELRQQSLAELDSLRRELSAVRAHLAEVLSQVSPALRDGLATELRAAESGLVQAQQAAEAAGRWTTSHSTAELSNAVRDIQSRLSSLRRTRNTARLVLVRQPEQRRTELATSLTRAESELKASRELIQRWLGADAVQQLATLLAEAREELQQWRLAAAEELVAPLSAQVSDAVADANRQEDAQVREEQLRQVNLLRREIHAAVHTITELLQNASPGLRETFAPQVERASQWMRVGAAEVKSAGDVGDEAAELAAAVAHLTEVHAEARERSEELFDTLTRVAAAARADTQAQVQTLAGEIQANEELLRNWLGAARVDAVHADLAMARDALEAHRYAAASVQCTEMRTVMSGEFSRVEALENQHRRRVYLLRGLRQVCTELGFQELEAPRLERPGDYNSRIVMSVDTFNHGPVTFHLSLDTVEADACISETHCFDEFDQLSQRLAETFGVQTQFQMADGSPRPVGKVMAERQEPARVQRERPV